MYDEIRNDVCQTKSQIVEKEDAIRYYSYQATDYATLEKGRMGNA